MTRVIAALIFAASWPLAATAGAAQPEPAATAAARAGPLADGEVRKVDKDARKITIRHGRIENLGMMPMTMVFQVKDPAMLDQVKAGDKIKFSADNVGGALTVTGLEPAK